MVKRIGGARRKTRHLTKKDVKKRGKISLTRFMQKFNIGDRVLLAVESAVQKGMYPLRFHSKIGKILKTEGTCYNVSIKDGKKEKQLTIHPVHLRGIQND